MPVLPPPSTEEPAPKSLGRTILTTTPVILTLLSTLLAGVSSGEMIRAQYFRSMAAQYQSKAGDQWNFFQAKRIRNTIIDQDLDLFPGNPVKIDAAQLLTAIKRLTDALPEGARQANDLQKAIEKAEVAGPAGQSMMRLARRLKDIAGEPPLESPRSLEEILNRLNSEPVRNALAKLNDKPFLETTVEDRKVNDPDIELALQAIRDRKPDSALVPLVKPIDETKLQEAVEDAELNGIAFEEKTGNLVERPLRDLDTVAKRLLRVAASFHRTAAELEAAMRDTVTEPGNREELRAAVQVVLQTDHTIDQELNCLQDYLAARKDFTARRYNREGYYNLQIAGPYELRVHKSSVTSDRHRQRSQQFFVAMLFAQAGAAIGSLAMAGKPKKSLWLLAFVTGLASVGYTGFVYLKV